MGNKLEDIYEEGANKWLKAKGVGSVHLAEPLDIIKFVVNILDRMIAKDSKLTSWIIVESIKSRMDVIYELENESKVTDLHRDAILNARCTVYSRDYAENYKYSDSFKRDVIITIDVHNFKKLSNVLDACSFRFKLCVIRDNSLIPDETLSLYKFAPLIYKITKPQLQNLALTSPVKESRIGCTLTSEDLKKYEEYTNYISDSVTIFGNFDTMEECKVGNRSLNISADSIRLQIAESNGWSNKMNMSDPMAEAIDKMYNPNALLERAINTFSIIRLRSDLVANNKVKLIEILNIVEKHKGEKILIISKSSDFASEVTDYINANIEYSGKSMPVKGEIFSTSIKFLQKPYCSNFHNNVEKVPAIEDGKPVLIKSGASKGEPKMLASGAQMKQNLRLFNEGYTKVLSANKAVDKSFNAVIDVLIIASPLCDNVRDIKYRLPNLSFSSTPNTIYRLYCMSTTEQNKLDKEISNDGDTIVNDSELSITLS